MRDLDIILAAHGAGDDSAANAMVNTLARRLEATLVGARVTASFIKGDPTYHAAIRHADRPQRLLIPLLMSDGHFASRLRDDAAHASAHASAHGSAPALARRAPVTVAAPVGVHAAFVDAVVQLVVRHLASHTHAAEGTHVLVVGHGTTRTTRSADSTRALAHAVSVATTLTAHIAFLDQSPSIEAALVAIPATATVLVIPFLFGGGEHAMHDVPARVTAGAALRGIPPSRIVWLDALGDLPQLAALLERIVREQRAARPAITIGARPSRLSRVQVDLFAARAEAAGCDVRFVPIDTAGDRDRARPLHAFAHDDVFTGDIDAALLSGTIDVAVHSFKDVPLTPIAAIVNAAVLPRGAVEDVLVSRGTVPLAALPHGARIGTSCARRALQVRRLRADLRPVPIRGDVEQRVAQVDGGDVDAVVLAAAGLERLGLHARIAQRFACDDIMPAPAQGAIVAQCRVDAPTHVCALLRALDDHDTHHAAVAERVFQRIVERHPFGVAGARAVLNGGAVTLDARVIHASTGAAFDTRVTGADAALVGERAAAQLFHAFVPRDARAQSAAS